MRPWVKQEVLDYLHEKAPEYVATIYNPQAEFTLQERSKVWKCVDVANALANFESKYGDTMEIKILDGKGLAPMIDALHLNGYSVQTTAVWKEGAEGGIDHFTIKIEGPYKRD
jgi:hypothetical protein